MRKAWFLSFLVLFVLAVCGISQAAMKVGTFGAPNSSGTAPMEVDSDRAITVASDATFSSGVTTSTSINVGTPTIGGVLGTNYVAIANGLEVDGDLYADGKTKATGDIFADGSIYLTATAPAAAAGVGLWISQPDGGCSKCYVDAAGTTWACANATCPTGM